MSTREHVRRLFAAFSSRQNALAISCAGTRMRYLALDARSRRFASALAGLGVGHGDRVALLSASSPDVVAVILGAHRIGALSVPINTRYREREVAHILEDCEPTALVLDGDPERGALVRGLAADLPQLVVGSGDELPAAIAGSPAVHDDDPALIIYTSGTTGPSKGAVLTYRALVSNMLALTGLWRWTSSDRLLLALPLFHVHGLCIGIHGAVLRGMSVLLHPTFDPAGVVEGFARDGATVFMGVPTMYRSLLDHLSVHPEDAEPLSRGRLFTAGSAALAAADFESFERQTGHGIVERYGMTETLITLSSPYDGDRRPGSVGLPVPGCEIRVVDEDGIELERGVMGELEVRGPGIMSGYFRQPDATRACWRDSWFRTGDLATMDADGYVSIVGRRSTDVVKTGGFKVSTREIEEVLLDHPSVSEVAVVGVPDARWGERIVAAVVRTGDEGTEAAEGELASFVASRLADYKKPRQVVFVDELPRNALGKLEKRRIVEMIRALETDGGS